MPSVLIQLLLWIDLMQINFSNNPNYRPNYKEFLDCMYLTGIPENLEKLLKVIRFIYWIILVGTC